MTINTKILSDTTNYRKIYESYYGKIPIDEDGRSYEIHHVDGNHNNNNISNLKCVSIQEHYDIHYAQGDWGACLLISRNMKISPERKSKLARQHNLKLVENGTHHLLGGASQRKHSRNIQLRKVRNGTHPWVGGTMQSKMARQRVIDGTHPLQGGDPQRKAAQKQLKLGSHPSQIVRICPHCNHTGNGGGMKRWHFNNCRAK